jgi:hypothetical protein
MDGPAGSTTRRRSVERQASVNLCNDRRRMGHAARVCSPPLAPNTLRPRRILLGAGVFLCAARGEFLRATEFRNGPTASTQRGVNATVPGAAERYRRLSPHTSQTSPAPHRARRCGDLEGEEVREYRVSVRPDRVMRCGLRARLCPTVTCLSEPHRARRCGAIGPSSLRAKTGLSEAASRKAMRAQQHSQ